jgi:peroxiredoxin family protein
MTIEAEMNRSICKPAPAENRESATIHRSAGDNRLNLIVFSGEMDKLLAAFVLATGAAASGMSVSMFFTFWATAALKKGRFQVKGKPWIERMFGWMLPSGLRKVPLSRLNMGGMGKWLISREMRRKKIPGLPQMLELAGELGVEILICDMSMSLMGIRQDELVEYPNRKTVGVAYCLNKCAGAQTTLFI